MTNENSAVDEFLGETNTVPENDPFKQESADPFAAVQTETKEEAVAEEEKPLPFHKDPKVQKFIEKEVAKKLADYQPQEKTETERFVKETGGDTDRITDVLTRIIGNDTPEKLSAIKEFREVLLEREDKGAEKALERIQNERQREALEEQQAVEELETGFERIEETYGVDLSSNNPVARKTRNEFVDFIRRVSPKDAEGEVTDFPDLDETFKLYQEMKKPSQTTSRAKDLSSRSMARSGDASNVPVSGDKSWNAIDKIFSKLTS